ncbi:MAG: AmmeMemoRadiSam system protein B [Desulfovibrionaceae bacterium]|nr:AmmeMemoRadiSam system protein B [Desulfovibrionaceae bacterium]
MDRQPVVVGRFYDGVPDNLNAVVDGFLAAGRGRRAEPTLLAMVPHAGYVFSGAVCGQTLAEAHLAQTVLLLGPNHTGRGEPFALWPEGTWHIPGGGVPVDTELTGELLAADSHISPDVEAHLGEHSLEVILPFLHRLDPAVAIAPMAVSMPYLDVLRQVGTNIGQALKALGRPVSIVVSSDMSHYISHDSAKRRDAMALDAAVALDPAGLFETVRSNNISMCGVMPMTVGLYAALELGATKGELVTYATSGEVSGDYDQVVGYAGVLVS